MPELTSDNDKTAGKTPDYRDEPWAREAILLPALERAMRAEACQTLLQGDRPAMSDALYAELLVYLEVIADDDTAGTVESG